MKLTYTHNTHTIKDDNLLLLFQKRKVLYNVGCLCYSVTLSIEIIKEVVIGNNHFRLFLKNLIYFLHSKKYY